MARVTLDMVVQRACAEAGLARDPFDARGPDGAPDTTARTRLYRGNLHINYVLLFPGSFNPPHQGHAALLRHVYASLGPDRHIVGAIIIPTDDERLAAKNSLDERPLLLTKAQRVQLWRQSGVLDPNRFWVFDGTEEEWARLKSRIEAVSMSCSARIRFILVVGPDRMAVACDPRSWGCQETASSDVSRPAEFRDAHAPLWLTRLPSCHAWEQVAAAQHQLPRAQAPATAAPTCQLQASVVLSCSSIPSKRGRPCSYRFVACMPGSSEPSENSPSSTSIRRLIATCDENSLLDKLDKTALAATLLLNHVRRGGPYSAPVPRPTLTREERKALAHDNAIW